jgi:ABC-type cobalt transport system substrate-binding protein
MILVTSYNIIFIIIIIIIKTIIIITFTDAKKKTWAHADEVCSSLLA